LLDKGGLVERSTGLKSGEAGEFRVALTLDAEHPDRPHHGDHTLWVLDELRRLGIRATVFLQGRWVEAFPTVARRVATDGHLIGNHSFYHAHMPLLSADGFDADVGKAERAIIDATGANPRPWLRFPFGVGVDRLDLMERTANLGYRHVGWDVEVDDWRPGRTATEVIDATLKGVAARGDGAIVLIHTWPDPVAPSLGEIVERLAGERARFVGIDELDLDPTLISIAPPPMVQASAG
jgi:peptidoglycan/xylan/chitin deacetylase (PgdA/CDA1 family)